jgi:hypothetical protein
MRLLGLLSVFALIFVLIGGIFVYLSPIVPTTRTSAYPAIITKHWHDTATISHFPHPLPEGTKVDKLHYRRKFLQGSTRLEVRMKTTNEHINQERIRYTEGNLNVWAGNTVPAYQFLYRNFRTINHTVTATGTNTISLLPKGFQVIQIERHHGNRGVESAIAVNEELSEIIYWTEEW